jgi:hypothetical protein
LRQKEQRGRERAALLPRTNLSSGWKRAADARRHVIPLLDIGVLPEAPMVCLNQHPAPRRARRDDLIALPSTWVVARIDGRAT